jgi:hypothetical protein
MTSRRPGAVDRLEAIMQKRVLGKSGLEVSAIGLGCLGINSVTGRRSTSSRASILGASRRHQASASSHTSDFSNSRNAACMHSFVSPKADQSIGIRDDARNPAASRMLSRQSRPRDPNLQRLRYLGWGQPWAPIRGQGPRPIHIRSACPSRRRRSRSYGAHRSETPHRRI